MIEFIAKMKQGTFCSHCNVYRTRLFIVHQLLVDKSIAPTINFRLSEDTFFLRTPERDAIYERIYLNRDTDGKRVKSEVYKRKYIYSTLVTGNGIF